MPDFYRVGSRVHVIRSSPGYDDALVGLSKADKDYLRDGQGNYTVASPGRAERIAEAAKRAEQPKRAGFRLAASAQENRFKPKQQRRLY